MSDLTAAAARAITQQAETIADGMEAARRRVAAMRPVAWDGLPPDPGTVGMHWLRWRHWWVAIGSEAMVLARWNARSRAWLLIGPGETHAPADVASRYDYIGPCVPPAPADNAMAGAAQTAWGMAASPAAGAAVGTPRWDGRPPMSFLTSPFLLHYRPTGQVVQMLWDSYAGAWSCFGIWRTYTPTEAAAMFDYVTSC